MESSRHFEQVPVQELKNIVKIDFPAEEISSLAPCSLCGFPVSLEACKVDEDGMAVHARCYAEKLGVTKKKS